MCCFSRPVDLVSGTHIFARPSKEGRQFLVYSMTLHTKEDVAMILPLPVVKDAKEDALRFINLEKYEGFFTDLQAGFAAPKTRAPAGGAFGGLDDKLKVVEVGSFEASFVPAIKDFARLDERFRLPATVWDSLPQYKESGFAVFKLKKGAKQIHPMAFEFPRANPKALFFPTVHIHDGKVHATARFDHALYCQHSPARDTTTRWQESLRPAGLFMKTDEAQGVLDPAVHVYRRELRGRYKNEDAILA
jgi:hypothetical protein